MLIYNILDKDGDVLEIKKKTEKTISISIIETGITSSVFFNKEQITKLIEILNGVLRDIIINEEGEE